MSNVIDVGHGHTLTRLANADGSLYGFVDEYTSLKTGEPCSGSVCVNPTPDDVKYHRDVWTMESADPLSPRRRCSARPTASTASFGTGSGCRPDLNISNAN
jgi:hypothetical protein